MLDPVGTRLALDVVAIESDVPPVQHGVLRRPDVDESSFHPREHILHAAAIDVPDDLQRLVLRAGHVMLDEGAAFEHRDLCPLGLDVDAHQIPADRLSTALAPTPP